MSVFESKSNPGYCLIMKDDSNLELEECSEFISKYTQEYKNVLNQESIKIKSLKGGGCLNVKSDGYIGGMGDCSSDTNKFVLYETKEAGKDIESIEFKLVNSTGDNIKPNIYRELAEQECKSYEDIYVGSSNRNTKTVILPRSNMIVIPKKINDHSAGDTFEVTVTGYQAEVRRTDSAGGWGMELILRACHRDYPGYRYVGCFKDKTSARDMTPGTRKKTNSMSTDYCYERCKGMGYNYFSLQNSDACWCGDSTYGKYGAAIETGKKCVKKCKGSNSICGGSSANSIYEIDGESQYTLIWVPTPTVCPGKYMPAGSIISYKSLMENDGYMEKISTNGERLDEMRMTEYGGTGTFGGDLCNLIDDNSEYVRYSNDSPVYIKLPKTNLNERVSDNVVFKFYQPSIYSGSSQNFLIDNGTTILTKIIAIDNEKTYYLSYDDTNYFLTEQDNNNDNYKFYVSSHSISTNENIIQINRGDISIKPKNSNKYIGNNDILVTSNSELTLKETNNTISNLQFMFNYPIDGNNKKFNITQIKNPEIKLRYDDSSDEFSKRFKTNGNDALDNDSFLFKLEPFSNIEPLTMNSTPQPEDSSVRNLDAYTLLRDIYDNMNSLSVEETQNKINEILPILQSHNYQTGAAFNINELNEISMLLSNITNIKSNVQYIYEYYNHAKDYTNMSQSQGKSYKSVLYDFEYDSNIVSTKIDEIDEYVTYINVLSQQLQETFDVSNYTVDTSMLRILNDIFSFYMNNATTLTNCNVFFDYLGLVNYSERSVCRNTQLFYIADSNSVTTDGYRTITEDLRTLINKYQLISTQTVFTFENYNFKTIFDHFFVEPIEGTVDKTYYEQHLDLFGLVPLYQNPMLNNSDRFGILDYHYVLLTFNMIISYIYEFYIDQINYVTSIINDSDTESFDNIYNTFYVNLKQYFNDKFSEMKANFLSIDNITNEVPVFERFEFINTIHTVGYTNNNDKMCNLKNALDQIGLPDNNEIYSLSKSFNSLSEYYHLNIIISYISNMVVGHLKSSISDNISVCPGPTASTSIVETMQNMESVDNTTNMNIYTDSISTLDFYNNLEYKDSNGNAYDGLGSYLPTKYMMSDSNNTQMCKTASGSDVPIEYSMNYMCGTNSYNITGDLTEGSINLSEKCKTQTSDTNCGKYKLKLEYEEDGDMITNIKLVVYNSINNKILKSKTVTIVNMDKRSFSSFFIGSATDEFLKELDSKGVKVITNSSIPLSSIEITDEQKENALYSEDGLFRLIINNKKMIIQSVVSPCKEFSGSSDRNMYGNLDDYAYVYKLRDRYNSNHIGKAGYIDNRGKMHVYKDLDNSIDQTKVGTNNEYEFYGGFIVPVESLDSILKIENAGNLITAMAHCDDDKDSVGLFHINEGFFKIRHEHLKTFYFDKNKKSFGIYLKKDHLDDEKIDKSCPRLSKHVKMIKSKQWEAYLNDSTVLNKDDVKCHINNYLDEFIKKRDESYSTMFRDYEEFMTLYNELNEEDRKYLENTKMNFDKMKDEMIKYNQLMQEVNLNSNIKNTVNAQFIESSRMQNQSEFFFAIGGLVTIGSLIALMKVMKK